MQQLPGSVPIASQQPNYAKRPFPLEQGTNDERIKALEYIIFGPEGGPEAEPDYIDPEYRVNPYEPEVPARWPTGQIGLLDRLAALERENERLRSVLGGNG